MKYILILLILFSTVFLGFGQKLHHQMIAAQGGTFIAKNGLVVRQSVGQMSVTGNAAAGNNIVQQGFQHSLISQIFAVFNTNTNNNTNTVVTSIYPNPFKGPLSITFSAPIAQDFSVTLFNMLGVLVFTKSFIAPQSVLNFSFGSLPAGSYVIHVTAKNYSFSKIIIKL
jgi:hypothetical protein